MVEGKDYKLNIRPQSADDDFTYPDSVINATNGKIFYVDVVAMGGYTFDNVAGGNTFAWGIDKFDFAAANVTSSGDTVTVKNGNMTVDPSDYTVTKDETAGTVTVAAKEGSKNYTGSQTVKMNNVQIQAPVISSVKVVGNKATVILSGESNGANYSCQTGTICQLERTCIFFSECVNEKYVRQPKEERQTKCR